MMEIIKVQRNNFPVFVIAMKVKELDITKCSRKFLSHNFDGEMVVHVKCLQDGTIDLRGKKEEYRIIPVAEIL